MTVNRLTGMRLIGLLLIMIAGWLSIVGSGDKSFADLVDSDDEVELTGTVQDEDGAAIENFFVEVFLENDLVTSVDTATTDETGSYTLTVDDSETVTRRYSRVDFATFNTRFERFRVDTAELDIEALADDDAEQIIDTAFEGLEFDVVDKAWLAVDVLDSGGNEVDGAQITTDPDEDGGGATFCDGTLTGSNITSAVPVCVPARDGWMYLVYFDEDQASVEIDVTDISGTITAPVTQGEITVVRAQQE